MKRQTRLVISLAVAFMALVLIGVAVQTIRSLLWDLSYFLPPWMRSIRRSTWPRLVDAASRRFRGAAVG